jgi:hypothetical protein
MKVFRLPDAAVFTVARITFSNAYPLGGEPIRPAQLGLTELFSGFAVVRSGGSRTGVSRVDFELDADDFRLGGFLRVINRTGQEVDPGSDLTRLVVDVFAVGNSRTKKSPAAKAHEREQKKRKRAQKPKLSERVKRSLEPTRALRGEQSR